MAGSSKKSERDFLLSAICCFLSVVYCALFQYSKLTYDYLYLR